MALKLRKITVRGYVVVVLGILLSSCSSGESTAPIEQESQQQPVGEQPVAIESLAPIDERNDDQTEIAAVDSTAAQEPVDEQRPATEPVVSTAPPAESQPMFDVFQLTDWPGDEHGSWTPNGSRILITGNPNDDGDQNLLVVDADGSNVVQLTDWPGTERVEGWSPDGSRILITGNPNDDGDQNLFVVDIDGSNVVQLTDWPGNESGSWSPDGSRILIDGNPNSTGWEEDDLFVVDADGSNVVQLTDWPGGESGSWSPDGSRILIDNYSRDYSRRDYNRDYNTDLFVVDADGSNLVQLTDWPGGEFGSWFPDGSRVLISGNPNEEQIFDGDFYGLNQDYYVVDVDGSNLVQLTDWPGVEQAYWFPDGYRMLISGVGSSGVYVVDVDELYLAQLTDWPDYIGPNYNYVGSYPYYISPSWSPDGSRVLIHSLYSEADIAYGTRDVYVIGADWSDWIGLTDWPGDEEGSWSPDGSKILIHSEPEDFWNVEEQDVYVVDVDGSNLVQLTDWPGYEWGSWSPDGSLILISGNPDSAKGDEDDVFVVRLFSQ